MKDNIIMALGALFGVLLLYGLIWAFAIGCVAMGFDKGVCGL